MKTKRARGLWIAAILLMGLTTTMNILGGAGTVCAAFLTKQFPPMWALLDYQLLYQTLMILTLLIGGAGIWATMGLVRGGSRVYSNALIVLLVGTGLGAIHVFASMALRGKAVPANMKLYFNAFTLLMFLLLRLPGIRDRVSFEARLDPADQATASGMAALITGLVILMTPVWVAGSHTYQGVEWVDVLRGPLDVSGGGLVIGGILRIGRLLLGNRWVEWRSFPARR